jgi:hypothetical protein
MFGRHGNTVPKVGRLLNSVTLIFGRPIAFGPSSSGDSLMKMSNGTIENKQKQFFTLNCVSDQEFQEHLSSIRLYYRNSKCCLMARDLLLRRKMKVNQSNHAGNVIPFQMRSEHGKHRADEARRDSIIRMLDLSKFEQPRPPVENDASTRTNIAAMVLLGLLVFLAAEDFGKLERPNLCVITNQAAF